MTKPLALVLYERFLPGTQLVNRLQDLGYRVITLSDPAQMETAALEYRPMVMLVDFSLDAPRVAAAIKTLRQNSNTNHVPVVAYCESPEKTGALEAGATLVADDKALVAHLPEYLEQALRLD